MSSFFPLKVNDDVRDETLRALIFDKALMISSAIPSAKNSPSGSALKLAKGSTAIDLTEPVPGVNGLPSGVLKWAATSARAKSIVVEKRPPASLDIALPSADSTSSGAAAKTERIDGTGSLNRLLSTACAVAPVNGLRPDSIS